jgi:hypothetical protein
MMLKLQPAAVVFFISVVADAAAADCQSCCNELKVQTNQIKKMKVQLNKVKEIMVRVARGLNETIATCPDSSWFRESGSCYKFVEVSLKWWNAKVDCETRGKCIKAEIFPSCVFMSK